MNFLEWFFKEEKDFDYYRNLILSKLNLKKDMGLSQDLNAWEPDNLINILNGLGEFRNLSSEIQDQIIGQIRSGSGTLHDIIRLMSASSREI
jgi:hypothetical protein